MPDRAKGDVRAIVFPVVFSFSLRYVECLYVESRGFILVVIDILISLARVLSLSSFLSLSRVALLACGSGSIGEKYENSFLSVDTPVHRTQV